MPKLAIQGKSQGSARARLPYRPFVRQVPVAIRLTSARKFACAPSAKMPYPRNCASRVSSTTSCGPTSSPSLKTGRSLPTCDPGRATLGRWSAGAVTAEDLSGDRRFRTGCCGGRDASCSRRASITNAPAVPWSPGLLEAPCATTGVISPAALGGCDTDPAGPLGLTVVTSIAVDGVPRCSPQLSSRAATR